MRVLRYLTQPQKFADPRKHDNIRFMPMYTDAEHVTIAKTALKAAIQSIAWCTLENKPEKLMKEVQAFTPYAPYNPIRQTPNRSHHTRHQSPRPFVCSFSRLRARACIKPNCWQIVYPFALTFRPSECQLVRQRSRFSDSVWYRAQAGILSGIHLSTSLKSQRFKLVIQHLFEKPTSTWLMEFI